MKLDLMVFDDKMTLSPLFKYASNNMTLQSTSEKRGISVSDRIERRLSVPITTSF